MEVCEWVSQVVIEDLGMQRKTTGVPKGTL